MNKIRSLNDCKQILSDMLFFVESIEQYEQYPAELIINNDIDICMVNGGSTRVRKMEENLFELYSSGPNWWDQEPHFKDLEYITRKLYRNRKSLNKSIQLMNTE